MWRDATVQVSGPFIRDKFWFFGSLEYQRDWDSQPGADPAYPAKSDARRMFWKFNYNINDNHRLLNGYHDDFYWIPQTTSAFNSPSTISLNHGHNPTPNVVYTGVLTSRTLIEVRYSGFWLQSSTDPNEAGQSRFGIRYTDDVSSLVTGAISEWRETAAGETGLRASYRITPTTCSAQPRPEDRSPIRLERQCHSQRSERYPADAQRRQAHRDDAVALLPGHSSDEFGRLRDDT